MKTICFVFCTLVFMSASSPDNFKSEQLKYSRVKAAWKTCYPGVSKTLKSNNLDEDNIEVFLRGFKSEKKLELWGKNKSENRFVLLATYPFCALSGMLGPKRKQGDFQVPEGFYHIDRFNPTSNFHLSLGINYPNQSDRILSSYSNKGGDIFIHGNCVTVGCIPITDSLIEELYIYCVLAKSSGQAKIPVHVFPFKMNPNHEDWSTDFVLYNAEKAQLWKNLKTGYDWFETKKLLPVVKVKANGIYEFS